jgi:hypothetical protein
LRRDSRFSGGSSSRPLPKNPQGCGDFLIRSECDDCSPANISVQSGKAEVLFLQLGEGAAGRRASCRALRASRRHQMCFGKEAVMTARWIVILSALMVPALAVAQEKPGAERTEVTAAVFGGGLLLVPTSIPNHDAARSYMMSGAIGRNLNRRLGAELDVGFAFGKHETHAVYGVTPTYPTTPNMLLYSGNLVYNPMASDHPFVPYFTLGIGALNVFGEPNGAADFAFATNTIHLTGSVGAGARWYPIRHWGVRGDYRYMGITNSTVAPGGQDVVNSGHRVYGALMMTF